MSYQISRKWNRQLMGQQVTKGKVSLSRIKVDLWECLGGGAGDGGGGHPNISPFMINGHKTSAYWQILTHFWKTIDLFPHQLLSCFLNGDQQEGNIELGQSLYECVQNVLSRSQSVTCDTKYTWQTKWEGSGRACDLATGISAHFLWLAWE